MLHIYIDADACPVKTEVFKVAKRCELLVTLVANSYMQVPSRDSIKLEVVDDSFDAADDWIVDHVEEHDIVITADIPLASRCIKKGASVLDHKGRAFDEDSIGHVVATRDLMAELRGAGEITGGPAPLQQKDRSRFLQQLDIAIQTIRRKNPAKPS